MFSHLMADSRREASGGSKPAPSKKKILHLSVNLPEDQADIVDRYFSLLYPTDMRTTRSAIIGVAIEILDRILQGALPGSLDASLLDAYARARADAQVGAQERALARQP